MNKNGQKLPKQIRVLKARLKNFWYRDHIGQIFNVTGTWNKNYLVRYQNEDNTYFVAFSDCEVIEQ